MTVTDRPIRSAAALSLAAAPVTGLLRRAASLRVTLACLAGLGLVLAAGQMADVPVQDLVPIPFALLFLNLAAALVTNPRIRAGGGLLVFHLALALIAALAALGQSTGMRGHVEVTEGAAFDPALVTAVRAGSLHRGRLDEIRFVQGGFTIDYGPGMRRGRTISRVHVAGEGGARVVEVGDDRPLRVAGYRLYTSFNKGFAADLIYAAEGRRPVRGGVHLPSYPLNEHIQGNDWTPPGGTRPVKLWLDLGRPLYDPDGAWQFRKPETATLVVIDGEDRHELLPGDTLDLPGGRLTYAGVRSWMGYTIHHDTTLPWMMAAALVGAFGLAGHILGQLRRRPWLREEAGDG